MRSILTVGAGGRDRALKDRVGRAGGREDEGDMDDFGRLDVQVEIRLGWYYHRIVSVRPTREHIHTAHSVVSWRCGSYAMQVWGQADSLVVDHRADPRASVSGRRI